MRGDIQFKTSLRDTEKKPIHQATAINAEVFVNYKNMFRNVQTNLFQVSINEFSYLWPFQAIQSEKKILSNLNKTTQIVLN